MTAPRHICYIGTSYSSDQGPPPIACVDAHRRRYGPYTAAGQLVRILVPEALKRWPDLVRRHDIELLTVAPELVEWISCDRETLTSSATAEERTRFYPRARTRRVAHGLVDFLNDHVTRLGVECTVVITSVDEADATDAEWLAILLRRAHPRLLRLTITSARELDGELGEAVTRHAAVEMEPVAADGPSTYHEVVDVFEAARRYVDSDGTTSEPASIAAYHAIDAAVRARLHDARADVLETAATPSARLGAIPYHRERGSDPEGAGVAALLAALEQSVLLGFYHTVIELGRRCLSLLRWVQRPEDCWLVVAKVSTALTALDRADEAANLYDEACARSTLPSVHLQAAYGRAMLYTRFYDDARIDHQRAKAHINTAIAISSLLPEGERRAFNLTFNENGLALIEMHLGDAEEALRLVTAGLDRLDDELGPDQQTLHRSVLLYNRAQLLTRIGPPTAALDEYDRLIASDPHHSEYYFERAALHRRLGDADAAAADYEAAIRLSPPYPEPHYNLADLALERGDLPTALAHLDRVIDLEPTFVDAYIARAGIHDHLGHPDLARADIEAGLTHVPDDPQLLCLAGVAALRQGDLAAARNAFDAAIDADPALTSAWANRAVLAFESGDAASAAADLSAALDLEDTADLRINRAITYESLERFADALVDYEHARRDGDVDIDTVEAGRQRCLAALQPSAAS
jgi:tetratricopeptide (TPR) repeat protein